MLADKLEGIGELRLRTAGYQHNCENYGLLSEWNYGDDILRGVDEDFSDCLGFCEQLHLDKHKLFGLLRHAVKLNAPIVRQFDNGLAPDRYTPAVFQLADGQFLYEHGGGNLCRCGHETKMNGYHPHNDKVFRHRARRGIG